MNKIVVFIVLAFTFVATSARAKDNGTLRVVIDPVFNGKPLILDKQQYTDENGDTLTVSVLRFYMSNIMLLSDHGVAVKEENSYHLISTEDSGSNIFLLKDIKAGNYKAMQFILGVDSMANVSGALGGDLDPAKGMYWTWNTGYIMAKLGGNSKVCKTLHHAFEFHIGGYMPPCQVARQESLSFTNSVSIKSGKVTTIHIAADVAAWFNGHKKIDLAKTNSVLIPGADAMMMADNYKNMFSFTRVENP